MQYNKVSCILPKNDPLNTVVMLMQTCTIRVITLMAQCIWALAVTRSALLCPTSPTSGSTGVAEFAQNPTLHTSHVIRTSLFAAPEAIPSSQRSCLHSPDQNSIRLDFDMELSLEMKAVVGPK